MARRSLSEESGTIKVHGFAHLENVLAGYSLLQLPLLDEVFDVPFRPLIAHLDEASKRLGRMR